jgi:capsular polysaccharide biosynthesis protein
VVPAGFGDGLILLLVDDAVGKSTVARIEADLRMLGATSVTATGDPSSTVDVLKAHPRLDAIVDLTSSSRIALFEALVWGLRDGGIYVAVGGARRWVRAVSSRRVAIEGASLAKSRERDELINSTGKPVRHGRIAVVAKRADHHLVVRHGEVEDVLLRHAGEGWGRVIARQDAYEYPSRATLVMHGEPSPGDKPAIITVPELSVREYHDAICHPREIVTRDNLILPDTYRHWQNKSLFHKRIQSATTSFGRLTGEAGGTTTRHEEGVFFDLDSAFPSHFGHLMTETISKFWGWRHAVQLYPDIRPVITHQSGKPALPAWKADVLNALGIPTERILWIGEGESARLDALVAAMPQLVNPRYIDENIRETWAEIARGVRSSPAAGGGAEKIFLSRRRQSQRVCSNTPEVEALFEELGFTVVLPEKLPFHEQVRMFSGARVIAGFGGSALFNAMFNPDAKMLVLTSRSYVAANEYLIAAANGNEIHYFWAPPALEQPSKGFSTDAYRSGFEFPVREHRDAISRAAS